MATSKRAKWNSFGDAGDARAVHPLQVGRVVFSGRELHGMADAVARRQLRQAKPVAEGVEAQRLGVDGDQGSEVEPVRQVVLVELDFHAGCIAHAGLTGKYDPIRLECRHELCAHPAAFPRPTRLGPVAGIVHHRDAAAGAVVCGGAAGAAAGPAHPAGGAGEAGPCAGTIGRRACPAHWRAPPTPGRRAAAGRRETRRHRAAAGRTQQPDCGRWRN